MRYVLKKALTSSIETGKGKTGTPVIGYVLFDLQTGKNEVFNRFEAYNAVSKYGATNVEALTRSVSCKEDAPDASGNIYYLKPTDGKKINEYLLPVD